MPDAPGPVSVVCTVRNEKASIGGLVAGVFGGTVAPAEFVVSDAGSDDGTREALDRLAAAEPRLRVLAVPGNRSRGRNAAIGAARHDLIACIDGGCLPAPDWLEQLVAPFAAGARWVGGFYRPVSDSVRSVCIGLTMVYVLEEAAGGGFLPSARSMAFTREAWSRVGGFPEHLEVSEDTAFDEAMQAAGVDMVFRPEAVVSWRPPRTLREQARVLWTWSRSDGRAGIASYGYLWSLRLVALSGIAVAVLGIVDLRLAPLGLLPVGALWWRQTRHKYRWASGVGRFVWIPVAWAVGLAARSAGFVVGAWERRRRGR